MIDPPCQHYTKKRYWLLWKSFSTRQNQCSSLTLTNYGISGLANCHKNKRDNTKTSPCRTVLKSLVPVLQAKELENGSDGDGMTMSEQVAQSRPQFYVTDDEIEGYLTKETGWDRVKTMFSKNEGKFGPEMQLVVESSQTCAFLSFLMTSIMGGIIAKDEFMESNKHTKYSSKFRALRSYNDAIFLGGVKYGAKWALKSGFFTATFVTTSQAIAVYRNKSSIFEYIAAGAVTGGFLRINLGLKGFVAGSIIGTVLGFAGGLFIFGAMKVGNETQEQRHYYAVQAQIQHKKEMEHYVNSAIDGVDSEVSVPITS